eukprot:CAMPEP_0115162974 /NCGR_PEP_ID=MMETSP0227-20121206/72247_1 /TAXON_ID=89957 /ORGANISM="Polarella glacialis, Strain CCMP 1383" /LENGTH=100 /DNA_ID=CAMNT_0002575219 /DNA_START=78 /DNA_END=376 /DNA_ORIENTATION=-
MATFAGWHAAVVDMRREAAESEVHKDLAARQHQYNSALVAWQLSCSRELRSGVFRAWAAEATELQEDRAQQVQSHEERAAQGLAKAMRMLQGESSGSLRL